MEQQHYTRIAIWLHWVIALLIIGQIIGGKVMMAMANSPTKFEIFQLHKSFGLIILILSIVRLLWRLTHKAPALPATMKPIERLGAKLSHIGFYVFMIAAPMSGWMMTSVSTPKIGTKIFKTIPWPDFPFLTRSEAAEVFFKDTHNILAIMMSLLLLLHVGAALKHHFVNHDNVLSRMLPFINPKG